MPFQKDDHSFHACHSFQEHHSCHFRLFCSDQLGPFALPIQVISKARGMTLGIHKLLLSPDRAELSDADRRRLLGLQRRVQCMAPRREKSTKHSPRKSRELPPQKKRQQQQKAGETRETPKKSGKLENNREKPKENQEATRKRSDKNEENPRNTGNMPMLNLRRLVHRLVGNVSRTAFLERFQVGVSTGPPKCMFCLAPKSPNTSIGFKPLVVESELNPRSLREICILDLKWQMEASCRVATFGKSSDRGSEIQHVTRVCSPFPL